MGVTTPEVEPEPETEEERVWAWRVRELRKLGIDEREAELLADITDVVDRIRKLTAMGCSPGTAARIVL